MSDSDQLTDEELARRVAERGEDSASGPARDYFEQLYRRHAPKLLAFLAARVRRSDLDDVHQTIWQRVWQNLPTGFQGGNFRAWLHQIARNHIIDLSRRRQADLLNEDSQVSDPRADDPREPILEQERMHILKRCLDRLEAEMASLVQARLSGESYDEICSRLQLQPARVHKLFFQAKERLTHCVERAFE